MDIDISGWILEFLLRQNSIDDKIVNDLIRVLPLPNNNPRFIKSLILRKVESDIEKGTISKCTIEFLEQIEELDHRVGTTEVSEAMKAAYSAVSMHRTIKSTEDISGDKSKKYASAVKRILSARICEMEKSDVGLVQDGLVHWVHDIEGGVLDTDVLRKFKELDVFKIIRGYVNDAKEKLGPSFLELACESILKDDALSEAMDLDEVSELRRAPTDVHEASGAHEVSKVNYKSKDNASTDDANDEASRAHEVSKHSNQSKESAPTDNAGAYSKGDVYSYVEASRAHEVSKPGNQSKDNSPTDDVGANGKGNG
ncbi:hypothetical protein E3N88_11191 [Mikania micrantha]|uniref:Uncharacterized protein n=1 Tax=Mikania micrantha TaxID=192012 RepID=A0A5N6PCP1_9ASTR|nr:hypothetical protein E3N88_11191 [Mikania micrantha]